MHQYKIGRIDSKSFVIIQVGASLQAQCYNVARERKYAGYKYIILLKDIQPRAWCTTLRAYEQSND